MGCYSNYTPYCTDELSLQWLKKAVDSFIFSVLKLKTAMLQISRTESECHETLTADKIWSSFVNITEQYD